MQQSVKRGFTLIELLVVIAIIGLLASVILASLNTARTKGRDARRIADMKSIQTANELFYNDFATYASTTAPLTPTYISAIPSDPISSVGAYKYAGLQALASAAATCGSYHLGAILENNNGALTSAPHMATGGTYPAADGSICTSSAADFNGASAYKCDGATAGYCYDVRP